MSGAILDELIAELRSRWNAGDFVPVEVLLGERRLDREEMLDLIYEEFRLRRKKGQRPNEGLLEQRFPEYQREIEALVNIHCVLEPDLLADVGLATRASSVEAVNSLGKRFQILGHLGRGTFANVWRCRDHKLNRDVAVKLPHRQRSALEPNVLREAQAAARLLHPNIVPVFEVVDEESSPFLVTAYIAGTDLREAIRNRTLSNSTAIRIMRNVASAVAYAHSQGILHRDLKPANILLDESFSPFVADFGLARPQASFESDHQVGTPAYMAPEQCDASPRPIDVRADIYAIGLIIHEVLTGKRMRPQGDPTVAELQQLGLSHDLAVVVAGCLRVDPERRYSSAAEVSDDLAQILEGRAPTRSPALSRWRSAITASRRTVVRYGLGLVGTSAIAGVSAGTIYSWTRPPNPLAQRMVYIDTQPAAAEIRVIRRSANDGEPLYKRGPVALGNSPLRTKLTPGDYLVAARFPDGTVHEVFRHVPQWNELGKRINRYLSWDEMPDKTVKLPKIVLPKAMPVRNYAEFNGLTYLSQPIARDAGLDSAAQNSEIADRERLFRYDEAIGTAESYGMRLPTVVEWTQLFENGSLEAINDLEWTCNFIVPPDTQVFDPAGYHRSIVCRNAVGARIITNQVSGRGALRCVRSRRAFAT